MDTSIDLKAAQQNALVEKTKTFLWTSAKEMKEDVDLSRDLIHSLDEYPTDEGTPFLNRTCKKCGVIRNEDNTTYRLKPKRKLTKTVQKAMKSRKNTKKKNRVLKKFINSKSMMVIHCKSCTYFERVPTSSRSEICALKSTEKLKMNRNKRKSDSSPRTILTSTPASKRKSVESFINSSMNSTNPSTPVSTPRNKKRRSSHLSQLLLNETIDSSSSSLADFLTNFQQ